MLHCTEKVIGTGVPCWCLFAGYPCSPDTAGAVRGHEAVPVPGLGLGEKPLHFSPAL